MLAFVFPTDEPDSMSDVTESLNLVEKVIGSPSTVLVIDANSGKLLVRRQDGSTTVMLDDVRLYPRILGDCVFVKSRNQNLVGDILIKRWFDRFVPFPGNRARLVFPDTDTNGHPLVIDKGEKESI